MANFTRKEYESASVASRSTQNRDRTPILFMGSLLNKDGASAVIRFPYHSMDDIIYTTTHTVMDYPGAHYGKKVQCLEDNCPLCEKGIKKDIRVFLKFLVYVQEGSTIVPKVVLWDRPAAFVDIDLKEAFDNYGDLANRLFKIKRTGEKISTRYTLMTIDKDHAVYNNTTCPADFSELETVDAARVMTKTYEQYQEALHPELAESTHAAPKAVEEVKPVVQEVAQPAPQPVVAPTPVAPQPTAKPAQETPTTVRANRYTF